MRLRIVLAAMAAFLTPQAALAEYTAAQLAEARVAGQTPFIGRELANAVYQRADGDCAARRQGLESAAAYLNRRRGNAGRMPVRLRMDLAQARYALEAELARRCQPRDPAPAPKPPALDPAPLAQPPSMPVDPCYAPTQSRMIDLCRRAAALLGRWTSRVHGGVIETTMTLDGKIVGRIITPNARMLANGYEPGMPILRGYTGQPSTLTWVAVARGGEYFMARQPDRKSGEPYGDARWQGGVVFIEVKKPDQLQLPAALENRLSNYDPWVRMGSSSAPR